MKDALQMAAEAMARRFARIVSTLERGETPPRRDTQAAACALAAYHILEAQDRAVSNREPFLAPCKVPS